MTSCWIRYLQSEQLFELLDRMYDSLKSRSESWILLLLGNVLLALQQSSASDANSEAGLRDRLPILLAIRSYLPDSTALEDMIAVALDSSSPICLDGRSISQSDADDMGSLLHRSETRWRSRLQPLPVELQLAGFLEQKTWSDATVKIVNRILHATPLPNNAFASWIKSEACRQRATSHLVSIFYTYFDSVHSRSKDIAPPESDDWIPYFSRLVPVVSDDQQPQKVRETAACCLSFMLAVMPTTVDHLVTLLVQHIETLPTNAITVEVLDVGARLHSKSPLNANPLLNALSHHGLRWAVENALHSETFDSRRIMERLSMYFPVPSSTFR